MSPRSVPGSRPPLAAITFDFGNTLVPVDRAALEAVVAALADAAAPAYGVDREAFLVAWAEERTRQFREEVPRFREVDLTVRLRRVLARLRGLRAPPPDEPWDDDAAAGAIDRGGDRARHRRLQPRLRGRPPARPGDRHAPGEAGAGVPPGDPVELAAGRDDRPLRRGGRLAAAPGRDRRLGASRNDQAAPGHLPRRRGGAGRGGASRRSTRARSSTSATTGRPTWSARRRPAGGLPTSAPGPPTPRCRRATPTATLHRISSSTAWPTCRQPSTGSRTTRSGAPRPRPARPGRGG